MLKELKTYQNLGTPSFFFELFNKLKNDEAEWNESHIREFFFNRIIDDRNVFDGCIPLAKRIGLLKPHSNGSLFLDESFTEFLASENFLRAKMLERVLLTLEEDEIFHQIFCSQNISYDIVYGSIQISNSAFRFKYANFKQFLIDFSFLSPHPDRSITKLIINPKFRKMFDKNVLPTIKRRKIGIEELEKLLEQKQLYGEEAEDFVLDYEKRRLAGHSKFDHIQKISEYDVAAGYDVVSYEDLTSQELDRFIEVKSFADAPNFYWSRNEMDVAKIKRDRYFLYLIDRSAMDKEGYIPLTIQNPYEAILKNESEWNKRVEKYYVSLR